MGVTFDLGSGGFDLWFTLPVVASSAWVKVTADGSAFVSGDADDSSREGSILLTRSATGWTIALQCTAGATIESYSVAYDPDGVMDVRITAHNEAISIVFNGMWIHTFWLKYVKHADDPVIYLSASGAMTVTDVRLVELYDCNDSIDIDIDAASANAIASTFMQRPVRVWPQYDGALCFAYEPPRSEVEIRSAKSWQVREQSSEKTASDMLVHHKDAVGVVIDTDILEDFGFITRALRYPEYEHGAMAAARVQIAEGRQEQQRWEIECAIEPELEMYDVVDLVATSGDALAGVEDTFIAEKVSFEVGSASGRMTIEGRGE